MEAALLRIARLDDCLPISEIYAPYVLGSIASFETTPPGPAEIARRMEQDGGAFPWLVCEADSRIEAYCYASSFGTRPGYGWVCQPSVYVAQGCRRKGHGRRLYQALCALLASQGYRSLVAVLAWPNPASERFHESMGFEQQGLLPTIGYKFGKPAGVAYYVKALLPPCENPPAPIPFSRLGKNEVSSILKKAAPKAGG